MKKKLFLLILITFNLNAHDLNNKASELALKLHLSAASKAIIQWERVFKSEKKMKRYKINMLTQEQQKILKTYLINHAIDSDQPTIAGI